MVKVVKSIIVRKPEDLPKLKYNIGIIFGRNNRKVEKKNWVKNDKNPR